MKAIKLYVAGKVSPNSVFGTHDWRDNFCQKLAELSGLRIINLDPTKSDSNFHLDHNNPELIFGRDCFMIKSADLVIVNLTDDISVGGSQEMLIAKYYTKPLIGIAPQGGKFSKEEKIGFDHKIYKNWIDPFVATTCDIVAKDIEEAADFIQKFAAQNNQVIKNIRLLDQSLEYYQKQHHQNDKFLYNLLNNDKN